MLNDVRAWMTVMVLALALPASAGKWDPILQLTTEERYDDDALLREVGDVRGPFVARISPEVGTTFKNKSTTFEVYYVPDVLWYETANHADVEHRGSVVLHKKFSDATKGDLDAKIWYVTNPDDLPRLGMARSLSPILYGKADLDVATEFTKRWSAKLGYHFEGAKIYEVGNPPPGFINAPYLETDYWVSHRVSVGVGYRYQLFNFGTQEGMGNSPYASVGYRITRQMTLNVAGGPEWYRDQNHPELSGLLPRFNIELFQQGPLLDLGLNIGHDLVGASGFTTALWADYVALTGAYKFTQVPVKIFAAAAYFRNGQPPSQNAYPIFDAPEGVSMGYSVGAGAEYRFNHWVAVQASFDRFGQFGGNAGLATADIARNVVAARVNMTAW